MEQQLFCKLVRALSFASLLRVLFFHELSWERKDAIEKD